MNDIQTQFINILSHGIRGKKSTEIIKDNIHWEGILEEAKAHKVEAIIYSAIDKSHHQYINNAVLNDFKRSTFLSGILQNRYMNQISKILNKFNEEHIEVVVIKGPVLRVLYPNPEFRTMSDLDIFIHRHDLEKIEKLIFEQGYERKSLDRWSLEYVKGDDIKIELKFPYRFKDRMEEEDILWENFSEIKILDVNILSLNLEDTVVQLCIHMANHITNTGFGVRQLSDLVLLVEKKGHLIDWNIVSQKIKVYGIEKFTLAIFMVCNKLFDLKIPKELKMEEIKESIYIENLIYIIFESGVYGKRYLNQRFSGRIARDGNNKAMGLLRKLLAEVFLPRKRLIDKYPYVNKSILLIPIAWINRMFDLILTKEYKMSEKFKLLFLSYSTAKQKKTLFNWLEL